MSTARAALMGIPNGITREHILQAIADLRVGTYTGFGRGRKYVLVFEGEKYSPKAVLGRAILPPDGKGAISQFLFRRSQHE